MLTEREAWSYLARLWHDAAVGACGCHCDHLGRRGICQQLTELCYKAIEISPVVCERMVGRIRAAARRRDKGLAEYLWPTNAAGAKARARFCERQAASLARKPTIKAKQRAGR